MNAENRSYQINAYIEDSSCDWMKVSLLSRTINQTNLIGIVGPACSGAALSASQYLDRWIPSVSFAATHESLSNRNSYPNFFRTVYALLSCGLFLQIPTTLCIRFIVHLTKEIASLFFQPWRQSSNFGYVECCKYTCFFLILV